MVLHFPEPLFEFVREFETVCVAGCCGLDAYDLSVGDLTGWQSGYDPLTVVTAATQLEGELAKVGRHRGRVAGHDMLFNEAWDTAADCLRYFEGWRAALSRALAAVGGPAVIHPSWLTPTVRGLVAGIVADRGFDRLPVLADALEEAGCDNRLVLDHLRGPGDHGPFCWVTDLFAAVG